MAINLVDGFNVTVAKPLDERLVVATLVARDAIPSGVRYEGMPVYVQETPKVKYFLSGGIANENWVVDGSGSGGGVSEWVTATEYVIDDQVVYENKIYKCIGDHTASADFHDDSADWTVILDPRIPRVLTLIGDRTQQIDDEILLVDTSSFSLPITYTLLPAASSNKLLRIKKVDSGPDEIIIQADGTEEIDGENTCTLFRQYDSISLISNGTFWSIL